MRLRYAGIVSAVLLAGAGTAGVLSLPAANAAGAPPVAASRPAPAVRAAAGGLPGAAGRFVTISVPGAIQTMPEAITDTGLIVGCYQPQSGPVLGFVDRNGRFSTVADPAAGKRSATLACLLGANDHGVMVGYYQANSGRLRGFADHDGKFSPVNDPAASRASGAGTRAVGVNDAGVVVGSYSRAGRDYGFVLRAGKYATVTDPAAGRQPGAGTVLNGISDRGAISGGYIAAHSGTHGLLYLDGRFSTLRVPLPGRSAAADAEAASTSPASGLLVGSYRRTASSQEAGFTCRRDACRALNDPMATAGTEPQSGNDSGRIVGIYRTGGGVQHGFAFTPRG